MLNSMKKVNQNRENRFKSSNDDKHENSEDQDASQDGAAFKNDNSLAEQNLLQRKQETPHTTKRIFPDESRFS